MPDEIAQGQQEQQGQEAQGDNQFDYDKWLGEQPEHVKSGLEKSTSGLKNALESERTQRKDFAKQIKDLSAKAEKGSEAEKALGEMSTRLEQAEQRAAFMEEAVKPENGCANPRAAFLVAQADGLFKRSGEPDWAAIKQAAPELFGRTKTPPGNAGSGKESPPAAQGGMNAFIRAAAGRG